MFKYILLIQLKKNIIPVFLKYLTALYEIKFPVMPHINVSHMNHHPHRNRMFANFIANLCYIKFALPMLLLQHLSAWNMLQTIFCKWSKGACLQSLVDCWMNNALMIHIFIWYVSESLRTAVHLTFPKIQHVCKQFCKTKLHT